MEATKTMLARQAWLQLRTNKSNTMDATKSLSVVKFPAHLTTHLNCWLTAAAATAAAEA